MKLNDLTERNQKFQNNVALITELIHHPAILDYCTQMIRSAKRIDSYLRKLLVSQTESQFNSIINVIEDETDEVIFILDQLADFDKKNNSQAMTGVIKQGFDLISIYSMACDKVIESRIAKDEFDM